MAFGGPKKQLYSETICSLCLNLFQDPVLTHCRHNFCRVCIIRHCQESPAPALCPLCRATVKLRNLRPNQQLANIVETIRKAKKGEKAEGRIGVCKKFFCKNDQVLICVVCDTSMEHWGHDVVPMEEAAQEYKDKFEALQQSLEKKRTTAIERKLAEEEKKQTFLTQIKLEKDEITSVFKEMQKFIKAKERLWLDQLGEMEKETEKIWEENITSLTKEIGRLSTLISEMAKKRQQPPIRLLQDIGSTLKRYQGGLLRQVVELSPRPEKRLRSYSQKRPVLLKAMENFEEFLEETFPKDSAKEIQNKVNVILDPDTAHPFLILTEGLTSVKWEDRYQDLPDCHTRFNREFCVLGQERFASGRHWWEVEVDEEKGAMWALGVARESVRRKGIFKFTPNEGIWAVGKKPYNSPSPCRLSVLNSPEWVPLNLSHEPRNIRVSLDYEESRLVFFDADTNKLIFAFSSVSFHDERIQPFFWVGSGVRLNL